MTNQPYNAPLVVSLREHAKDDEYPGIQAALREAADEIERLGGRLRAAEAERDAWVKAVDAHVRRKVWQTKSGYWQAFDAGCELFCSRREAEAAYRRAAGLEVPGRAAPID